MIKKAKYILNWFKNPSFGGVWGGLVLLCSAAHAQTAIDIENIPNAFKANKWLRVNGNVAASAIHTGGNAASNLRSPFLWNLNANVNANILGQINLPFSFNITDVGTQYTHPVAPTRLSLMPTYKWITAYIGDANMTFSPYTLNGHLFRGLGVQVRPNDALQLSVMYGRFQKAVPYDSLNRSLVASYKRMGYGANIELKKEKYNVGVSFFGAKDEMNSLTNLPDSIPIQPKQNIAASIHGGVQLNNDLELTAEYGTSILTEDLRAANTDEKNIFKDVIPNKTSTHYFHALKAGLNYTYKTSSIGVGYERVDPNYQTLGAYYFVNDVENITINLAQSLFKEKAKLNANLGFQKDDLDGNKASTNKRVVGSASLNYTPSEKLMLDLSYSNFQTYMNIKPQAIQDTISLQPVDTLNFTQIAQNATANVNYTISSNKQYSHVLSLMLSFQDAADKQGGILSRGNGSQFYNAMLSYTLNLVPQHINISAGVNTSYNTIGRNDFMMLSPKLGLSARLWKDKINLNGSASYNISTASGTQQVNIFNIRAQAAYTLLKKHQIGLSINTQSRNSKTIRTTDVITMFNYSYGF